MSFILGSRGLKNRLLFLLHFPPPHTAENIQLKFYDFVSEKNLKVFMCVTDNAANMIKAFKVRVFPAASAPRNSSLTHFHDSDDSSDSESDDSDQEMETELLNSEDIFKGALRCCAHSLQLVVHDGMLSIKDDARA